MYGVIRVSDHRENAENVLGTVAEFHQHFKAVYYVDSQYQDKSKPFDSWDDLVGALRKSNVPVHVVGGLDLMRLPDTVKDRLIEIHPYTMLKQGAFQVLDDTLLQLQQAGYERIVHYGLQSIIYIQEPTNRSLLLSVYHAITGYGFLMVMHWIDFWWRLWSRGKIYTERDVRAHYVVHTYKRAYVPDASFTDRLWNRGTMPMHSGRKTALFIPPRAWSGWKTVRYTINTHSHQGWGLWWVGFFFILYYWFALPWWNLLSVTSITRPLVGPLTLALYLFNTAILWWGTSQSLYVPQQAILCVLFPIYVTLYPLAWFIARLYRPEIKLL